MCKLLELAREKQGNVSYYEMAKIVGVSDQVMAKWKKNESKPNGLHTLKLAELAELDVKQARMTLERGFTSVILLLVSSMAGIALAFCMPYIVTMYIMLNRVYHGVANSTEYQPS